jgi:enamine deaminase RidA (YjgF/YER057c/UK114 family)
MFTVVDTGLAPSKGPVNGTVRAGNVIYTAQVPRDPNTGEMTGGDITVQMRQTLTNLKQAMESVGGTLEDIAQVVIYLVDSADGPAMNAVYQEFFKQPYPSRATIVVKELMGPTMRVELIAHAYLGT